MAQNTLPVLATSTDVFQNGSLHWKQFEVDNSSCPKPFLIFTPIVAGTYPVIVFNHGFFIHNKYYSQLLGHITSHGFIVVAPILLEMAMLWDHNIEVEFAGKVVDWLADGLQAQLDEKVQAKLETLVLAGHSRGGKTAFAVALGYAQTKLKYSALIGIDPVAGQSNCNETLPRILTHVPQYFNLNIPVAVIGTGLGPEKANIVCPPCAPDGVNHKEFFKKCKPPCAHIVTTDYGHTDMLDDDISFGGEMLKFVCKNGAGPKDLMRRTVGGLVVAFLRAHLYGHGKDLDTILANPNLAPAKLDPVEYVPA